MSWYEPCPKCERDTQFSRQDLMCDTCMGREANAFWDALPTIEARQEFLCKIRGVKDMRGLCENIFAVYVGHPENQDHYDDNFESLHCDKCVCTTPHYTIFGIECVICDDEENVRGWMEKPLDQLLEICYAKTVKREIVPHIGPDVDIFVSELLPRNFNMTPKKEYIESMAHTDVYSKF